MTGGGGKPLLLIGVNFIGVSWARAGGAAGGLVAEAHRCRLGSRHDIRYLVG